MNETMAILIDMLMCCVYILNKAQVFFFLLYAVTLHQKTVPSIHIKTKPYKVGSVCFKVQHEANK